MRRDSRRQLYACVIDEVDTCRREAIAKMDTIRKHPLFLDLAIDGSRDTFKDEVWPILSEYAGNWKMAFDGSIIMIDEDWRTQAEDLKKILAITENIQVL